MQTLSFKSKSTIIVIKVEWLWKPLDCLVYVFQKVDFDRPGERTVVLNRTVVVDSDRRFDNLCGSHLQS